MTTRKSTHAWASTTSLTAFGFTLLLGCKAEDPIGKANEVSATSSAVIELPQLVETNFSDALHWDQVQYYSTIRYPLLNNDSKSDVCGRGPTGIYCATDDGTSAFTGGHLWSTYFTDAIGWNQAQFYSTMAFPDVNHDGRADVCGRFSDGIHCALNDGSGHFKDSHGSSAGTDIWTSKFGAGWTLPEDYLTISFPDVNGDGFPDVCGRGSDGVHCALNNKKGAFTNESIWNSTFTDTNGFNLPQYYSTIGFPRLNADASADLCMRGIFGILCAVSNGVNGFYNSAQPPSKAAADLWTSGFSNAAGFDQEAYYSSIAYPVLAASGLSGVCGRTPQGILCGAVSGHSFTTPTLWTQAFSGSSVGPEYYRTLKFPPNLGWPLALGATPATPSAAGVCGRWPGGVYCQQNADYPGFPPNDGSGNLQSRFGYLWLASTDEDNPSFNSPQYYSTITITSDLKLCERAAAGVRCSAGSNPGQPFPFLYGSSPANNNQTGSMGYNGPNPTFQGIGFWANHLSIQPGPVGSCTLPNCDTGPMKPDSNGRVLVIPVRWQTLGCAGTSAPTLTASNLTNFFNVLAPSSYYAWIAREYGLPPLFASPSAPLTATTSGCSFVEQDLINAVDNGAFGPIVPTSTIFAVHLPPNLGGTVDGYHGDNIVSGPNRAGDRLHYYKIPDPSVSGDAWTAVAAHELLETLTDPFRAGWRNRVTRNCPKFGCIDTQGGDDQIGDICNNSPLAITGGPGTSQITAPYIWSNAGNGCMFDRAGTAGDVSRSGASSIVLAGTGSNNVAAAVSAGNGNRTSTLSFSNPTMDNPTNWKTWETTVGVKFVSGDFDGDGLSDVAATGPSTWSSVPVRLARTSGSFLVKNYGFTRFPAPGTLKLDGGLNFPFDASQNPLGPVSGDFNGDGLSDIALVGYQQGWSTIPIIFSAGDGQHFWPANYPDTAFNAVVNQNAVRPRLISGDFNGDGLTDMAALGLEVGTTVQTSIAVALSNGDASFTTIVVPTSYSTGGPVTDVNTWALDPTVQIVTGDFNGDGLGDIALLRCGATGWVSVPVVFGSAGQLGTGIPTPGKLTSFIITNQGGTNATFASAFASQAGAKLVAGDFDGDGSSDLALTGPAGWTSVPIAFSTSTRATAPANLGLFSILNDPILSFPALASQTGVVPLSASQGR